MSRKIATQSYLFVAVFELIALVYLLFSHRMVHEGKTFCLSLCGFVYSKSRPFLLQLTKYRIWPCVWDLIVPMIQHHHHIEYHAYYKASPVHI